MDDETPPCGDTGCRRKHRPNGGHYSADRSERRRQQNADSGVDLAEQGRRGRLIQLDRKRREVESANAAVAAAAADEREAIIRAYTAGLRSGNERVRLQAANELLRVERDHLDATAQAEEDAWGRLTVEEQWRELQQMTAEIASMVGDGEIVDADAIELVPHRTRLTA